MSCKSLVARDLLHRITPGPIRAAEQIVPTVHQQRMPMQEPASSNAANLTESIRKSGLRLPDFGMFRLRCAENRTAVGFLLPEKTTRRRSRVAPGLFDPWDHPCHTPQCFMAAGLWFPEVLFYPIAGTTVDTPPRASSGCPCKTNLHQFFFHASRLKNSPISRHPQNAAKHEQEASCPSFGFGDGDDLVREAALEAEVEAGA